MTRIETTRRTFLATVAAGALPSLLGHARVAAAMQGVGASTSTLIACGAAQVIALTLQFDGANVAIVDRTDWEAGNSAGMPAELVTTLRTTDDCKPIDNGVRLLVTSSSAGVAIVERATGRTEFYARVTNAHSAEVLPGGRLVVAASTGADGNRLVVFDRARSAVELFSTPLYSAHGAHWVEAERTLWAIGLDQLQAYELVDWDTAKPSLRLRQWLKLPSRGGHDLSPVPGTSKFNVTTEHEVLLFDRATGQFTRHPEIGPLVNVKSVTVHPVTGRTAYTLADPPDWWTSTVRFLDPAATLAFPGERLYKVRWA